MTDPQPVPDAAPRPPRPGVSPARKAVSLVVLVALVIVAGLEFSARNKYNSAVTALDARTRNQANGFPTTRDTEALLHKTPDDAGRDVQMNNMTFTRKTYTWRGLFRPYTLAAFYTKDPDARLHHYETAGAEFAPEESDAEVNFNPSQAPTPAPPPATPAAPPADTKADTKAQ